MASRRLTIRLWRFGPSDALRYRPQLVDDVGDVVAYTDNFYASAVEAYDEGRRARLLAQKSLDSLPTWWVAA